nr:hypothetical protein BaRGS_008367 [Batillaria attramentaria]
MVWKGRVHRQLALKAKRKPTFQQKKQEVVLSPYDFDGTPVYTAKADDMDGTYACASQGVCPCAQIHYSILSGNDDLHFRIDPETGSVTVSKESIPYGGEVHNLVIEAKNPGADDSDVMELKVVVPSWDEAVGGRHYLDQFGEGYMQAPQPHHIHKRAVTLPDNMTFTLTKEGVNENITEMRVGTRVSFKLQILFPAVGSDLLVELFAPDNDSIVMMLCDVKVESVGDNLSPSLSGEVVMDSQNSSTVFFDRAIIDFGDVTVGADYSTEEKSTIVITWDAVMIQNDNTLDQTVYWVSAGAEYNSENEVWVGQASLTARTNAEPTTFDTPTFNLTGPDSMPIGTSAVFTLDMYITEPSAFLSIDAFAPLNNTDVMSICGMQLVDTGANYLCGFDPLSVSSTLHADDNTRGHGRARLELGVLTNKGAREDGNPQENNRITVQFVVHLYDDVTYIGESFWVGAAVEIGADQIWAGEILVAAQALAVSSSITPTWELTKGGSGKVSTVAPLLMTLDISIPENTIGKYALEVLAPFNDSEAVFQLCSIRIVDFGENLACTEQDITPTYSSRGTNSIYADRGYADFGTISNVGSWGHAYNATDPNATEPNLLRVQFLMKATNHTLATVGSSHSVTLGLIINDNRLLIGSYGVEVEADAAVPNITDETTPDWALTWVSGDGNIPIGGSSQFLMSITTKRNTVYKPFDIEALMPNGTGSTMVSVCQVQVHSIGKNLPCLLPESLNDSVVYTSLLGDGLNDRAVLNMPSACNYEVVNDTAEDVLVLKVSFRLENNHPDLVNGTEMWPSVGVMFSPYKMWVGQIKAIARDDITVSSGSPPYVSIVQSSTEDVPIGYFASYNVLIKTNPGDLVSYTINVTTSTTGLSICSVRIAKVGDNMPCTNGSLLEAWYEQDINGVNIRGSIDIGPTSNVGNGIMVADDNIDDDTIVVEVMVGLTSDTAVLAAGSSHTFDVEVNHDGTAITQTSPAFTVTHDTSGINMTANNITDVTYAVAPITETDNDTDVVLGQSKRFTACAYTYPGAVTKLAFKMLTPVDEYGHLEAVYIGFSSSGKNLPCLTTPCKAGVVTYEKRPSSEFVDVATLDFGYVYNNNFDPVDPEANKVCADGVFRVLKNDTLTPGDSVLATASVNVNDQEITILQESLTVVDNSTFVDIYSDNATLVNGTIVQTNASFTSPQCVAPGTVTTFPVLVSIPPYVTSLVNMDLKLDVNQSACMTFLEARLLGVGSNLQGFGKDYDMTCTPNSTMDSTQMDAVECSFGVVTNPGMSHRCGEPLDEDDMIYLEMDLQMADCWAADNGAEFTASFGLKVAGYIAILNFPVQVCRDGTETPIYNISAVANSTGDVMYVNYDVRLDNTSSAEVHNATMYLYPPPYVSCQTLEGSSGTNMVPVVTTEQTRTTIEIGSLYFTDAATLLLKCEANTTYSVPEGINGYFTVVMHELSGDITPRPIAPSAPSTVWSDMDFVNFTATTTSAGSGISCTPAQLGMNNSTVVQDCQITSSPDSLPGFDHLKGRKNGLGWKPFVRSGRLATQRYFQVCWGNKVLVNQVEVDYKTSAKATQIKLAYSDDGVSFIDGDEITLDDTQTTQIVDVPNPQESRVLRVYVTNDNNNGKPVGLTFEFYGCETTSNVTDKCANAPSMPTTDALYFRRSFLPTATTIFVCDGIVGAKGTEQRCYSSPDGTVWKELDTRLGCMVGHDSEINRVYALANDGLTHMASDDDGLTWASTDPGVLTTSKNKGAVFTDAMGVHQVDDATLDPGNYVLSSWRATYNALEKNEGGTWTAKIKWDCC